MDTFIQYAVAASLMAMEDAGLSINSNSDKENSRKIGVFIGTCWGGIPAIEKNYQILLEKGYKKVSPFCIPSGLPNLAAGQVAIRLQAKGPISCSADACAAATNAIGEAFRAIQRGEVDIMVAGGAESLTTPLILSALCLMNALSRRNDEPHKASRPFDRDRDGFVMSEGAGILILEELAHALDRGARIYAEIVGYGRSGDAYHILSPSPDGEEASRCMQLALDDACLAPEQVDYINAHGTSTIYNDRSETLAIKKVFKNHAYKLAISSNKSMIGHLMGASGGVEAIFTILSIYHDIIPPTINYENPDPECDLDYVPVKARAQSISVALSNSFGFGGVNSTLVFKKYT
jgi:3-oxoacyl-[acyl-carrier-protein] synthase II